MIKGKREQESYLYLEVRFTKQLSYRERKFGILLRFDGPARIHSNGEFGERNLVQQEAGL